MSRESYLDELDVDLEELPPTIRAQLEQWESAHHMMIPQVARRDRKYRVRRQIEDWTDTRRMRDDLDYIR